MKGSDEIEMTVNIGGELLKIGTSFEDQNGVRDAEREVKLYIDKIKKLWPGSSDRKILAMAAFRFAKWYLQVLKVQNEAIELTTLKCRQIDEWNEVPLPDLSEGQDY